MSDSTSAAKKSTGSGKKPKSSSTADGAATVNHLPIREFLYLDFSKLSSYLAQTFEGLTKYRQRVTGNEKGRRIADPEYETAFEGSGGVGANAPEGAADPAAILARLLGITMKLEAQVSQLVKTGGDERTLNQSRYLIETKELHHEIFSIVQEEFLKRDWISIDDEQDDNKPFHVITGITDFIDFKELAQTTETFPELGRNFAAVTGGENPTKGAKNTKNLAYMIRASYRDLLGVVITHEDAVCTAYLRDDSLTAPFSFISDNYGRQTQLEMTLFGLKIGQRYPTEETNGEKPFNSDENDPDSEDDGEDQTMDPTRARLGSMAGSLLSLNRAKEGMDRFYRIRGDIHLYPLALYIDFKTK